MEGDVKYSKAIAKLEEIIEKFEAEDIDVDELVQKVKIASDLILNCKGKIEKVEIEVKKIVDVLNEDMPV